MIQLQTDCLYFQMANGQTIPCSAKSVVVELIGTESEGLDSEVVQNAAQAVLHYFRHELGRQLVTVGEFAEILEKTLRSLGVSIRGSEEGVGVGEAVEADLRILALEAGEGYELAFFRRLREVLREQAGRQGAMIRLKGLRGCVKLLAGARRWDRRCQALHDQIVVFVRQSLRAEVGGQATTVVLR